MHLRGGSRRGAGTGAGALGDVLPQPEFARWFARLGDAVERLSDEKPKRMIAVQHALIDRVDFLDADHERFADSRSRIEVPGPADPLAAG